MKLFLKLGENKHVEIGERVEFVTTKLTYNPLDVGRGVVGFHLRGDKVVPVIDLNSKLGFPKTGNVVYIGFDRVTFAVSHSGFSLEKPDSEPVDLESIEREILECLGVTGWRDSRR